MCVCVDKYAPLFSFSLLAMVVLYGCVPSQGCIGTQVDLGTDRSCTFCLLYTNEIHWVSSSPPQPGRVCIIITIFLFYYKTQTYTPLSSSNKQQMYEHMCKLQLRQSKHDNTLYKHSNLRFHLGAFACN